MNYQQTIRSDGSTDPDSIIVISDSDIRSVAWSDATDPVWAAYQTWLAAGNTPLPLYAGLSLPDVAKALANSIDARVAMVYSTWTRFQQEYLAREAAAQAFKDAGYTGDPGVWVSAFATAAAMSNQAAADLILSQATGLNNALSALGALRMRKYEVLNAADADAAIAAYNNVIADINAVAVTIQ